jgi:hypothetical protein
VGTVRGAAVLACLGDQDHGLAAPGGGNHVRNSQVNSAEHDRH